LDLGDHGWDIDGTRVDIVIVLRDRRQGLGAAPSRRAHGDTLSSAAPGQIFIPRL
jgi:hypothetical protein